MYRSTLFGAKLEAVDKQDIYPFGFVPCIKLNKKVLNRELNLSDVDYMVSYQYKHTTEGPDTIKNVMIAPGDVLKQNDPICEYEYLYRTPEWLVKKYGDHTSIRHETMNATDAGTVIDVFITEGKEYRGHFAVYSYL